MIEAEVRRLRERGAELDRSDIRTAHEQLETIQTERDRQREKIGQLSHSAVPTGESAPLTTVVVGQTVRHSRTGKTGTVKSVRGDRVEVQFGALRMQVPLEELSQVESDASADDPATRNGGSSAPVYHSQDRTSKERNGGATFELDIRGKTAARGA